MNNGLFGASELSTINDERLEYIKQYALSKYQIYINKTTNKPRLLKEVVNCTSMSRKNKEIIYKPCHMTYSTQLSLQQYIIYKASSKSFPLNNDVEKIFFMCCGIFPNDEKFLNTLAEHNFLNIFDEFIETYFYIDEKYKNNETLAKMQKYMQYKKLIKVHSNELIELREYFSKFHCINDINLIINKLLQIYYFNLELYNSYTESNEDKKTNQKVNKIV